MANPNKMDKIGKGNKNPDPPPENGGNDGKGIDFDHPFFAALTEAGKRFVRKNAEHFTIFKGEWCVNPAILLVAGYTPGTDETSPGFQRSRSKNLRLRTWTEERIEKGEKKLVEASNADTDDRRNIAAYIRDYADTGYNHGRITLLYVGGEKITPGIWVQAGRHRVAAAQESGHPWVPFEFTTGKVAGQLRDLGENLHRTDLTIAALAEQVHALYGKTEGDVTYTLELISEKTGLKLEDCKLYHTVMKKIIPEFREAASAETKNASGDTLAFSTSLKLIADAIPADKESENLHMQKDLLSRWMAGEVSIKDFCNKIKLQKKQGATAAELLANVGNGGNADTSGDDPDDDGKNRRKNINAAVYPANCGLTGVQLRNFLLSDALVNGTFSGEVLRQFGLSVIGWAEVPTQIAEYFETFDFDEKKKPSSSKTKPKVSHSSAPVLSDAASKVASELSYDEIRSIREKLAGLSPARRTATVEPVKAPEDPTEGIDFGFLGGENTEETPKGESFP